ncbi:MAG: hypothetical protein RIR51_663 [Bacteroidota bacterium]
MENSNKRYWKGVEELKNETSFVKNIHNEFGSMPSENDSKGDSIVDGGGTHRRDFLKMLGFGVAAVSLAACEAPVKNAIPYINKPLDVDPTIANYYASTFIDGGEYASVLVKTREGRPIKIEGNKLSPITQGGISARAQASVLSLYDNEKLKGPQDGGKSTDWANLDKNIIAKLDSISASGGQIRIVSNTILSPTTKKVIADFASKYSTTKHITYDANSAYGLSLAHGGNLPEIDFSKANTIVSIGADFLGTWIAPTEFARQWSETRKVSSSAEGKKTMSRHYQFETILSNTGANADYRATYKPSQEGLVVAALYNEVAKLTGASAINTPSLKIEKLAEAAKDLVSSKGASIVVSGSNDPQVQKLVVAINQLVGAYGSTINTGVNVNYRQGSDSEMNSFIADLTAGNIAAVIFYNANPVYNHPMGAKIADGIKKAQLSIATNERADETASLCNYIAPDSHYLESWNDAEPKSGYYSLSQPAISTIFKTRQAQASFLTWAGKDADYASYLKNNWKSKANLNDAGWNGLLHDGVFGSNTAVSSASPNVNLSEIASSLSSGYKASNEGLEISIYEKVGLGTGSQANNPWLQEFPEPVSKACWDNYASVSQITASELGLKQDDVVKVSGNGYSVELPVLVQPGQADNTIAIAIGYGRTNAGKSADGVGANAYPFISEKNGACVGSCTNGVSIEKTGEEKKIAQTQTHHTVMAREAVIQETVLAEFVKNPQAGRHIPEITTAEGKKKATDISLWNGHNYNNHHWGMVIDLNSCTGCSACVVACSAENNVPVVGRQEVINRREMHWMRIDRYYSSDAEVEDLKGLEVASNNPEVVFQPMLCQHCDNAPCETVCPVLATTHSTEGLNQMTYNRCIGTRYCANNCPYKVRRFNWFRYYQTDEFDFHFNNDLGRMVLNPDVTVRSRGVMEKCSMCVQRIQEGKLNAKKEKRRPIDGEIQVACAQTCPTNAITFGDKNDPNSAISKLLSEEREGRAYGVIEEINVAPNIAYLSKVRNKNNN